MSSKKKSSESGKGSGRICEGEEYRFIKETIKGKPLNKKVLIKKFAAVLGAAVLFGAVSALVFAAVYPAAAGRLRDEREASRIDIDVDEPSETPEPSEAPEASAAPQIVEVPRSITLEDYERIYEEIQQVADGPEKSMVTVTGVAKDENLLDNSHVSYGQAYGVIIAKNNSQIYVLTTRDALGDAERAQITFCDGAVAGGALKKADDGTGLAVVEIPVEKIKKRTREAIAVAELGNSYSLMQGKPVIAIGSPTGYQNAVVYGNIVSVSSKVSVVDAEYNLLVTDILGSARGSGVLLDTGGSVIGIISQNFGENSDTMVKALSVSQLKSLLAVLSNGEPISYAGVYGQDVSEDLARTEKIPEGIYVDSVEAESPAMAAGIQSADVITEFNGKEVLTMQRFSTELQSCAGDAKVPITVKRRGDEDYVEMKFEITIGAK